MKLKLYRIIKYYYELNDEDKKLFLEGNYNHNIDGIRDFINEDESYYCTDYYEEEDIQIDSATNANVVIENWLND